MIVQECAVREHWVTRLAVDRCNVRSRSTYRWQQIQHLAAVCAHVSLGLVEVTCGYPCPTDLYVLKQCQSDNVCVCEQCQTDYVCVCVCEVLKHCDRDILRPRQEVMNVGDQDDSRISSLSAYCCFIPLFSLVVSVFHFPNGRYIDCLSLTYATNKSKTLKLQYRY